MNKLIEAIDAERPEHPSSRYAIGFDDGLVKAKKVVEQTGFVSAETHKAVMKQRDMALAYIDDHGIQFGGNAPDVVLVVRCCKCKSYDHGSGYCRFWHGVRHPGHYCGEGEKKDG